VRRSLAASLAWIESSIVFIGARVCWFLGVSLYWAPYRNFIGEFFKGRVYCRDIYWQRGWSKKWSVLRMSAAAFQGSLVSGDYFFVSVFRSIGLSALGLRRCTWWSMLILAGWWGHVIWCLAAAFEFPVLCNVCDIVEGKPLRLATEVSRWILIPRVRSWVGIWWWWRRRVVCFISSWVRWGRGSQFCFFSLW